MITRVSRQSRTVIILPIVLMILGGLVVLSHSRPASSQPALTNDTPEACVARLLAAERAGALTDYLECFSEQQRTELHASWQAQTDRQTIAELRDRSSGLVGHAISDLEFAAPDRASLVLERIEKDHTARQRIDLQQIDGRWLITKLATADWQRTAIPYGTPVFTPSRGDAK